ncbi:hypothetical protein ACWGJX_31215 [Streptomyces sp. NPDC054775]
MQAKLHQWAVDDPDRRFHDLYNLVHHPEFLTVAWERVRGNKGARTAGLDRVIPAFIAGDADIVAFLMNTREQLKARTFTPLPVRERMIPKPGSGGKLRRLGDSHRDGQARASCARAGPGADLRGVLQAGQLWLSPRTTSP